MEKVIYIHPEKGHTEKTFTGDAATQEQCLFAYQLAFPGKPDIREIQLWTDDKKTLTIRP